MKREREYMLEAIEMAKNGIALNEGGPFGCIIVKDNKIIGRGNNRVTSSNDPTAHAEIVAIRDACKTLQSFQLSDCEIYCSCEPCPMCLGAIYWARPKKIYYAGTREDAAQAGFDDSMIYDEMGAAVENRKIPLRALEREAVLPVFKAWIEKMDKTNY